MSSLSTTLRPITGSAEAANASGATVAPTTVGGGTQGVVQTRGPSGNAISTIGTAGSTTATGMDTTASGVGASANGDGASAYGAWASTQGENTTAIGFRAVAKFAGSVAIGHNARAVADPATAVGDNSLASGNDSVALGASAQATGNRAVALGAFSVADQPNTVSVGSPGEERRITNVAPGVQATDAVNVSQLRDVSRIAYSGTALSLAMSGAVMPDLASGELGIAMGVGNYRGYSAMSLRMQGSTQGGLSWGVGVASTGKEWGVQMGMGLKWK